jgi:hypothetical protein
MEPVAWAVMEGDDFLFLTKEESAASSCAEDTGGKFVPLFRLSDVEGEIACARAVAEMMLQGTGQQMAEALAQRVIDGETIGRWISLDERLPEMDERVMIGNATDGWVTVGSRQLTGAYHHWDGDDHEELCEPTHWMPLPEQPGAL